MSISNALAQFAESLAPKVDLGNIEPEPEVEDIVNEPNHYKHGSYEVIDEMVIVFGIEDTIKFCRMNAWKYRARAPFKGNMEQDMAKANCYLEMAADLEAIRNRSFELLKAGKVRTYG